MPTLFMTLLLIYMSSMWHFTKSFLILLGASADVGDQIYDLVCVCLYASIFLFEVAVFNCRLCMHPYLCKGTVIYCSIMYVCISLSEEVVLYCSIE